MTNRKVAHHNYVPGASRSPRTPDTLQHALDDLIRRARTLMETEERQQVAARIIELRERSPYTQPVMADKLGISLRGYQKLEENGTQSYERCKELVAIHRAWAHRDPHWQHLDAEWIYTGLGDPADHGVNDTPDLMLALSKASGGLPGALAEQMERLNGEISDLRDAVLHLTADNLRLHQELQELIAMGRRGSAEGGERR